ncbi:ImmA/IrrE family metallo-endopeptidase [Niallia sp. 03190]|uniref:ImmA/IrrE family metallo-endopeptidase n=1 Tax=Niallia sp. 03190 TaxID=3458061 RepID=UPI004044A220
MIPGKLKVAGIEYEVKEVPNMEEDYNQLGQIFYTRGIIKLDSQLSKERKEQCLIHELTHAIFFEAGYEEQDEDMINRVGIVLYQVLKDNNLSFGKPERISIDAKKIAELMVIHPNT